ncbi:4Fe-4S binding protein [Desulfosoma caldarium]|uniref:4Fe-4S binding protein n=1 Tax=Desulfosoma caldarium TaxID=610254 RepID=A0A3N1UIP8_9BACT|nr:4Fe-4S binding protein [Desulfosoma caldarium]ROQ91134.1 4Fe-4S binding protein [Desulfosoma caldarium]
MRIHHVRRLSQTYFLILFVFLCAVTRLGTEWTQIRAWPVNWFLQLNPLSAVGTALGTGTLFAGLLWGLVTLSATLLLGRFFCGWVCPFGTLQHVLGWLGMRRKSFSQRVAANAYHSAHRLKFIFLFMVFGMACGPLWTPDRWTSWSSAAKTLGLFTAAAALVLGTASQGNAESGKRPSRLEDGLTGAAVFLFGLTLARFPVAVGSLQTGLLDPIALLQRSLNQVLFPAFGLFQPEGLAGNRWTQGAWLLGAVFLAALGLNLVKPRFYCRYLCPAGALMHLVGRHSLWRMTRITDRCTDCKRCETVCDAACRPSMEILSGECTLCGNCLVVCPEKAITYCRAPLPAKAAAPGAVDLSRRQVLVALGAGLFAAPVIRLDGLSQHRFPPNVIRPPGSLAEPEFLRRCIKCGQCLRICPTNVLQPALWEAGLEGLWTPVLDFRAGTSGCQYQCVACSRICPTAAIRRLTVDEKHGTGAFADRGPVRLGAAFVDRNRCLPWAFGKPCIVCEENCPVSPKAIQTMETLDKLPMPPLRVTAREDNRWIVDGFRPVEHRAPLESLWLVKDFGNPSFQWPIRDWGDGWIEVSYTDPKGHGHAATIEKPEGAVFLAVKLKRPLVDHARCVGCGICEHECPVRGVPAIRVTPENETRHPERSLMARQPSGTF